MSNQLQIILKHIRKTNKKSYKLNYIQSDLPCVWASNTTDYSYWKGGKKFTAKKRLNLGSNVFLLSLTYSDPELRVLISKNKIIISDNIFFYENYPKIYEAKDMSTEDYFNLSIVYPNIPSPHEIEVLRNEMLKKRTRFNEISIMFGIR